MILFQSYTLAVINIGAPAGGMNSAVSAFVRSALYEGHRVVGIRDGFDGLIRDEVFYRNIFFCIFREFLFGFLFQVHEKLFSFDNILFNPLTTKYLLLEI